MKFKVQTPSGTGIMVKAFYRHRIKYCRVSFTKETYHIIKRGKKSIKVIDRKKSVKDFIYSDCTIIRTESRLKRFLRRIAKSLNL